MDAVEFVRKWSDSSLRERQASQSHFIDLCALLGVPNPTDDDQAGDRYCFERGAEKVGGGDGWADVWRKGCFGWEYKGKHANLAAALRQLQAYALNLENPPYLVVSDMERIEVHTNWTNTVSRTIEFTLRDLLDPARRAELRLVFEGSDSLKPAVTTQELTAKAAASFGELGKRLQEREHEPRAVAHFLNRLVFCMFAEDAGLLPKGLFTRTIRATQNRPAAAQAQLTDLFGKMARPGDTFFGADFIRWFNGGLFDDDSTLPLLPADLKLIADTAEEHDWSQIDPSIFGTMFEQALKATRERPALGAHYTDREKILKIVEPVIVRPLTAEWEAVCAEVVRLADEMTAAEADRRAVFERAAEAMRIDPAAAKSGEGKRQAELRQIARRRAAAQADATERVRDWLDRLADFRVLDPACGSGNFLYVALQELLDLEQRAILDAERLGLSGFAARVGLQCVRGIEIERYAAELARLTLWIGYLQWIRRRGGRPIDEPILSTLDQIENRDALLNADATEAEWPEADAIIGNPPFAGDKRQRELLDPDYLAALRARFENHVPASANLVAYWFYKAAQQMKGGRSDRAGLVSTQAIRRGSSFRVLREALDGAVAIEAWSNEPWAIAGAAIRVSMVCWANAWDRAVYLDGQAVERINPDLTADTATTRPPTLVENSSVAFQGTISGGPLEVEGTVARQFLGMPLNSNGRPNSDVLKPWRNGDDLTGRPSDFWIVDFGDGASEQAAALYEAPFERLRRAWAASDEDHLARGERRLREGEPRTREKWWLPQRRRSSLLQALHSQPSFLATPRVSKHRFFVWLQSPTVPDTRLVVFVDANDVCFGILQSIQHEVWSTRFGGRHGAGNDPEYVHTQTFDTFPFPEGLTPNIPGSAYLDEPRALAIAEAAGNLNALREAWLNPSDLVVRTPEVVEGFPDRLLPRDDEAATALKQRTLTKLYNERPTWLDMAHRNLDATVAAAYGWPANLSDEEMLERLFLLNQERAAAGR